MLAIDGIKMASTGFIDFAINYISNISNLYNKNVNLSLSFQTIRDQMFPDPDSYNIFSDLFRYVPDLSCLI